jgi:hypothetical protein
MPKINIVLDRSDMEQAEFVFAPGDALAISLCGAFNVSREWADGANDPGVTVSQAEILRDLADVGITLVLDENGKLTVADY